MTVLVTGGAGYIGSHMVHELHDAEEAVVVLDDLSTGRVSALPKSVPVVVGSIGDFEQVTKIISEHRVKAIIHFAASVVVSESVRDPIGYYRNNTANTCILLAAAVAGKVPHIIFSSTAAVYGNPDTNPVSEDAGIKPMSPYGSSKRMSEIMLDDAALANNFRYVALRYFNVAGADPKLRTGQSTADATHLIKVAAQVAIGLRAGIDIYGTDYPTPDGTCIRDYIHVCDLVRAHSAALNYLRRGGDNAIINCGYGHGSSVREVLAAIKRISGIDFPIRSAGRRKGDPAQLVADVRRIHATVDWSPKYDDLDVIVAHALAWENHLLTEKESVKEAVAFEKSR